MNVLSLFNGMGFGRMALDTLCLPVTKYYSSEIDKYANQAANALFPDTIQIGDVTKWREWDIDLGSIDLLIAGFPCQAWSMAGKMQGDSDPRGALVHDLIDIWNEIRKHNPGVKFMFENVKMKKEFLDYINDLFGVDPVCINSSLVSAQNRVRYYWANIEGVEQPEDKGVILADIIEHGICASTIMTNKFSKRQKGRKCLVDSPKDKAVNLSAMEYVKNGRQGDYIKCNEAGEQIVFSLNDTERHSGITENNRGYRPHKGDASKSGLSELGRILKPSASKTDTVTTSHMPKLAVSSDINNLQYRKLTVRECARLQTVPEHHIDTLLNAGISNTQLYKMLGNGWTHDVITHIFKGLV